MKFPNEVTAEMLRHTGLKDSGNTWRVEQNLEEERRYNQTVPAEGIARAKAIWERGQCKLLMEDFPHLGTEICYSFRVKQQHSGYHFCMKEHKLTANLSKIHNYMTLISKAAMRCCIPLRFVQYDIPIIQELFYSYNKWQFCCKFSVKKQ